MGFYELNQEERKNRYKEILTKLSDALTEKDYAAWKILFEDEDTYIRKAAYLSVGKIYRNDSQMLVTILELLEKLFLEDNYRIRQTVIYSCGEIATENFNSVQLLIEKGMTDKHHSVRNAVIGALKKSGEVNPKEILPFCEYNIISPNAQIRRISCHAIELRGRAHPSEVINILERIQHDKSKQVKAMLIHVLGQISYKKGCLHYVSEQVRTWENQDIYSLYQKEVIQVHKRYERFSEFTVDYVVRYFKDNNEI